VLRNDWKCGRRSRWNLFSAAESDAHVQRRNHQDRQFGNMWDLAGLLIVNLLYLTDQQIRYLPT